MKITETHGARFHLAIERFREGHPFRFYGVGFIMASDGALELLVPTTWLPANVTEQTAMRDFERASQLADLLIDSSPEFASIVGGRARRSVLVNDYGMGAVELCRLTAGSLTWRCGAPVRGTTT